MKKLLSLIFITVFTTTSCFAASHSLSYLVKKGSPIKVFVQPFSNDSGNDQVSTNEFQKYFEDALKNRKSVNFTLEKSPENADIKISGIIINYKYMDKGPFKPSAGVAITALDMMATMSGNYAEMKVDFIITDARSGDVIWQGDVSHYIKRSMTNNESMPILFDHISRRFLWKSFGKG